jgi:DnaK suppressor protein
MTTPLEISHRTGSPTDPRFSTSQADTLRVLLIAGMGEQSAQFAQHAAALAALAANATQDPTGRDRAMAALHMFTAREAIEEIEDALVRIDDGGYGKCQSCDQPIPLERLQMIPQTRTCAACPRPVAAGGPAAPRLGPGRGEHTGPPSARGVLAAVSTEFASHVEGGT